MLTVCTGPRQSGRTLKMVKLSAETNAVIVCATWQAVNNAKDLAKKHGFTIPEPVMLVDFLKNWAQSVNTGNFLIDDLDVCLNKMGVTAATLTSVCTEQTTYPIENK